MIDSGAGLAMPPTGTCAGNGPGRPGRAPIPAARVALIGMALMAVVVAAPNGLLESIGASPQFCFTLTGSFAIYLATRPTRRELSVTVALALALRVAYGATYGVRPYFGAQWIAMGAFLGVASLAALAWSAVRGRRVAVMGAASFFPFVSILVGFVLPITNRLSPLTFDKHLLAADGAIGFQPSFLAGRLIAGSPALWNVTSTLYYALPLAVALLCAAEIRKRPHEVRRLLWLFGCMSAAGFCLYAVCPATGPAYAFRQWYPAAIPVLDASGPLPVSGAPRNAIPSLHFATALLVFWNTRHLRFTAQAAAAAFLAGTTFAILALGEHYVVDAVVALPFSLFFQAAFCRPPLRPAWRYRAMAVSAVCVLLWLVMLRFGAHGLAAWPGVVVTGLVATTVFAVIGERGLRRVAGFSDGRIEG